MRFYPVPIDHRMFVLARIQDPEKQFIRGGVRNHFRVHRPIHDPLSDGGAGAHTIDGQPRSNPLHEFPSSVRLLENR